jgi:hypothetical protein
MSPFTRRAIFDVTHYNFLAQISSNILNLTNLLFCRPYYTNVWRVCNPYFVLFKKLIEDASEKYRQGTGASPIRKPKYSAWARN